MKFFAKKAEFYHFLIFNRLEARPNMHFNETVR